MSETSPEGLAAVQATLAEQAQSVTGNPAAAGIYGDPAGAAQPPVPLDLSAATPVAVDAGEMLARLQALEAQLEQARKDAEPAPPEPPDLTLRADSNAPGWLHALMALIESRLSAVEEKLGL